MEIKDMHTARLRANYLLREILSYQKRLKGSDYCVSQ